jgi:hypothetical protein
MEYHHPSMVDEAYLGARMGLEGSYFPAGAAGYGSTIMRSRSPADEYFRGGSHTPRGLHELDLQEIVRR